VLAKRGHRDAAQRERGRVVAQGDAPERALRVVDCTGAAAAISELVAMGPDSGQAPASCDLERKLSNQPPDLLNRWPVGKPAAAGSGVGTVYSPTTFVEVDPPKPLFPYGLQNGARFLLSQLLTTW
jgi:hypothetical protein